MLINSDELRKLFTDDHLTDISSNSMKGSFILPGCSWANDVTSFFMFCSDKSSLHLSRLIFINASELNLFSVIVECRAVLINFN